MSIIGVLLKLIARSDEIERKQCEILRRSDEQLQLSEANLKVLHAQQKLLHKIALDAGDIRVALPLIREIHTAVVPEPVAKIVLSANHQEAKEVNIQNGQKSNITYEAFGASGNETTPVGVPQWLASDLTNFSLEVAEDSQSAVLTSLQDSAQTCEVTMTVDGVTSDPLEYDNVPVVVLPPPPEAVAKVVLSGTTPA